MKIEVHTPEGKIVDGTDATEPVGTALRVVPRFVVDAEDPDTGLGNTLDVDYDESEGRFVVRRATTWLLSGGEVSGTELRRARLAAVLQSAAPQCVAFPIDEHGGTLVTAAAMSAQGRLLPEWMTAPIRDADKVKGDHARSEVREARLEAVQLIYGIAALTGRPPAKALEDELGMTERTAVHWIKQARDAGLLQGVRYAAARPARG